MALEHEITDELVRGAQHGDAAALSRLLAAVRPRVYRWALVQTGSPDEAEDLTQEALLRATRRLDDYAFAARFTTWVHAIVRRTAADWRRTQKRRAALLFEHGPAGTSVHQPEVRAEIADIVRGSLGTLTGRQREVFDLVDLQGYSPGEAAAVLDMNAATLRVHLLRARRQVRTSILAMHPHIVEDVT